MHRGAVSKGNPSELDSVRITQGLSIKGANWGAASFTARSARRPRPLGSTPKGNRVPVLHASSRCARRDAPYTLVAPSALAAAQPLFAPRRADGREIAPIAAR